MFRALLDAGHYGKRNRSPCVFAYYESEAMWKLHLALKKALEEGYEDVKVDITREEQAKDLVNFINENSKNPEIGIWNTNIFGKSIEQIVEDGIQSKMNVMTEDSRGKLQETIYKVINDGNGGLVCIII